MQKFLLILILFQLSNQVTLNGNKLLVTYVDRPTSFWGGNSVADALAVPTLSPLTPYNVIILAFILEYGAADAADIWARPFSYME
jgi:hypothetical protein